MQRRRSFLVAAGVVGSLLAASADCRAHEVITLFTGGTSGVYYPLGVGLAKIFDAKIANSRTAVQATKATVENLSLLQQGRGEIAFALGDGLAQGWIGDAEAGFRGKLDKLRGIATIYPNYIQIVASRESGIATLADLKGKRLSVGAPRSGTELNTRAVLAAAGMTYGDLGGVKYLPFGESVELIKKGQLDATLQSAGLGVASISHLAASISIFVVEIPDTVIDKLGPPFVKATIPANSYPGQTAPVKTAGIGNYLVTRADMRDDLVYAMTKSIFENLDALRIAHPAGAGIRIENALQGMPIPLHPGAKRYFDERGVKAD